MLCFRNAKETTFVSRVKYTFVPTRDCKSYSPVRHLNPYISVTSTQSRHFFFFYRELFSRLDCSPCSPKKTFFLNERNRIEHCLRQGLLQQFKWQPMGRRLSKTFFSFYKDKFCPDLTYILGYGILQQYVIYCDVM